MVEAGIPPTGLDIPDANAVVSTAARYNAAVCRYSQTSNRFALIGEIGVPPTLRQIKKPQASGFESGDEELAVLRKAQRPIRDTPLRSYLKGKDAGRPIPN